MLLPILLQSLAIASLGIIAPISITLVILMLMSDRGWHNGLSFAVGYVVSYFVIGFGVLVLELGRVRHAVGGRGPDDVSFVLIIIGVVLLAFAVRTWYRQASGGEQSTVFAILANNMTPLRAFAVAAVASVVNLKNFAIFVSAASVIGLSRIHPPTKMVMLIPVVFIFCLCVIVPVVIYRAFPDRAIDYLGIVRDGLTRYSRAISLTVTLLLSALFLFRGISGLL